MEDSFKIQKAPVADATEKVVSQTIRSIHDDRARGSNDASVINGGQMSTSEMSGKSHSEIQWLNSGKFSECG